MCLEGTCDWFTICHKTEVMKNTLNPVWKPFSIPVRALCNGDYDRHLNWPLCTTCLNPTLVKSTPEMKMHLYAYSCRRCSNSSLIPRDVLKILKIYGSSPCFCDAYYIPHHAVSACVQGDPKYKRYFCSFTNATVVLLPCQ
ncbi:uncharacterized protein LOC128607889 isoform X1 [Ictalurus furcatus]|uniref:uncharacterized protein LOC128607889 isoform X1 n=1 Tax=Ictalurus furcatus TaxID=66913 RepID=UPI002350BD6D|nr:uncharacterized protein LOC128607889 isoform X1 [Ictalurus furcatus]